MLCALLTLVCFSFTANAQKKKSTPDLCSNAIYIASGAVVTGDLSSATADDVSSCGIGMSNESLWYKTNGTDYQIILSTCGSGATDTRISVFTGNCGSFTCVATNDQGYGCSDSGAELAFLSNKNTTYYIMVDVASGTPGTFTLSYNSGPFGSPENDEPSNAEHVQCDMSMSGTLSGSTADPAYDCGNGAEPGVWFVMEGNDEPIALSLCSSSGSFDSRIEVFTGTTCVASNEDMCGDHAGLVFNSLSGTDYLFHVSSVAGVPGSFILDIDCGTAPSNNGPCVATSLSPGITTTFDNTFATIKPGELGGGTGTGTNSCQSQDGWCDSDPDAQKSLWYSFTPPPSGVIEVIVSSERDMQVALWSLGDCETPGTGTLIRANDENASGEGPKIRMTACLDPVGVYYIQLDGHNGAFGTGTLSLEEITLDPLTVTAPVTVFKPIGIPEIMEATFISVAPDNGLAPYTYTWTGPGIVGDHDGVSIEVDPGATGLHTYTCTVDDAACNSLTVTVDLEVADIDCSAAHDGTMMEMHTEEDVAGGGVTTVDICMPVAEFMKKRFWTQLRHVPGFSPVGGLTVYETNRVVIQQSLCGKAGDPAYMRDLVVAPNTVYYCSPFENKWNTIDVAGQLQLDARAATYETLKLTISGAGSIVAVGDGCPDILCCEYFGPPIGGTKRIDGSVRAHEIEIQNGDPATYRDSNEPFVGGDVELVGGGRTAVGPSWLGHDQIIGTECTSCFDKKYNGALLPVTIELCTDTNPDSLGLIVQDLITLDTLVNIALGDLDSACFCYTFELCLPDTACISFNFTDLSIGFDTCAVDSIQHRYSITFGDTTYYSPSGGTFLGGQYEFIYVNCPGGPGAKRELPGFQINADESSGMRLSPNPAIDQAALYLSLPADDANMQVELLNLSGQRLQMLYTGEMNSGEARSIPIDTSELPAGIYIVRATGNNGSMIRKLVVTD